jgi:hypothetical protein
MKNESRIRDNVCDLLEINSDKAKFDNINNEIKTSVDFKFKLGKVNFLFEVDSNNVAKIIFGQYLLLNKVKNLPENPFLIIIHCYKGYNPKRTNKHLNYAKEVYNCRIPYIAITNDEWIKIIKNKSKAKLEEYLISLYEKTTCTQK